MDEEDLIELVMSDIGLIREEAEDAVDVLGSDVLNY